MKLLRKPMSSAVLAYLTPFVLNFGWTSLTVGAHVPIRIMPAVSKAVGLALFFAAPFLGYAFIAYALWKGRDLRRGEVLFGVGTSALYWVVYIPLLYVWLIAYGIGKAGGI